eukprot:scaffold870_cov268-Pinguiococcus_pyrenoidosus.AAC.77
MEENDKSGRDTARSSDLQWKTPHALHAGKYFHAVLLALGTPAKRGLALPLRSFRFGLCSLPESKEDGCKRSRGEIRLLLGAKSAQTHTACPPDPRLLASGAMWRDQNLAKEAPHGVLRPQPDLNRFFAGIRL